MPITPLHLGILAPINHFFPKKVSNLSFLLITLWMDAEIILHLFFQGPVREFHGPHTHSFLAAFSISTIVAGVGVVAMVLWDIHRPIRNAPHRALAWILGAYLGGLTHILLDMLVHPEMQPLAPWTKSNPFYLDAMLPVTVLLVVPTAWFILQSVSGKGDVIRRAWDRQ